MNYLFVYGLLKSDYDNEAAKTIRSHCTLIGEGYTFGRMFDLGTYPGIIYEKTSNLKVFGEVYRIDRNARDLIVFWMPLKNADLNSMNPMNTAKKLFQLL